MDRLHYNSAQALKTFLEERGLGMRKKFGQNFLINPGAREKLLNALEISPGDPVWEIGPGLGAMTWGLLDRGAQVTAFEIDPAFSAVLEEMFQGRAAFSLVKGDALKTWTSAGGGEYLAGNLPYNIAAALLGDFIEGNKFFKRMVVTVQREMARRMTARPGEADYSSFSVLCASAYTMTPLMVLKGSSFYPAPHVDSQGIRLDLRSDRDPAGYPRLFRSLTRALFSSRRKTVKNNLEAFVASRPGLPGKTTGKKALQDFAVAALTASGIRREERAENLCLEQFAALAGALEESHGD